MTTPIDNAATEIARLVLPKLTALHAELLRPQIVAILERHFGEQPADTELVEVAYKEGWDEAYGKITWGRCEHRDWQKSNAKAALDAEKGADDELSNQ